MDVVNLNDRNIIILSLLILIIGFSASRLNFESISSKAFYIPSSLQKPDLIIQNVVYTSSTNRIEFEVCNKGLGISTKAFVIEFKTSKMTNPMGTPFSTLSVNQCVKVDFRAEDIIFAEGDIVTITADIQNAIAELKEDNNVFVRYALTRSCSTDDDCLTRSCSTDDYCSGSTNFPVCSAPHFALLGLQISPMYNQCVPNCRESDNGKNYFSKGNIYGFCYDCDVPIIGTNNDACADAAGNIIIGSGPKLMEFYCRDNGGWVRETITCPFGKSCTNGACRRDCIDPDNGINTSIGTTVTYFSEKRTDMCMGDEYNSLKEVYCDANDQPAYEVVSCSVQCKNGACVDCSDTDGGMDYNVKGVVTDSSGSFEDYCLEGATSSGPNLGERWCADGVAHFTAYACPNGCENGACRAGGPIVRPDLTIEDITYTAPNMKIEYCNRGGGSSANTFTIEIKTSKKRVALGGSVTVPPAGECRLTGSILASGIDFVEGDLVTATVDIGNQIIESDETNNVFSKILPTLCELTSAYWGSEDAEEGDTVDLIVLGNEDCDGLDASFIIYEVDSDDETDYDVDSCTFGDVRCETSWDAVYDPEEYDKDQGDPIEFYFTATVDDLEITSSNELEITEETYGPSGDGGDGDGGYYGDYIDTYCGTVTTCEEYPEYPTDLCAMDLCGTGLPCALDPNIGCYELGSSVADYATNFDCPDYGECGAEVESKQVREKCNCLSADAATCAAAPAFYTNRQEVSCAEVEEFPFFDNFSLLIAVILLAVFYLIRKRFYSRNLAI